MSEENTNKTVDKETLEKAPGAVQEAVSNAVQEVASVDQSYVEAISQKAKTFIENNYTEAQRAEIYKSLQQDDNGDVYWQDGKDFVKLSLDENGRLRKGVMRDTHDDGTYKEFKFGAKETSLHYKSREVQEDGNLVKKKVSVKTNGDETVAKQRSSNSSIGLLNGAKQVEKMQVTVNAEGQVIDAYLSSSQTVGNAFAGNFQYGKETVRVSYGSDGKPVYVSDQTRNVGVSITEGKASASSSLAKAEFNENGQVEKMTSSTSEVHISGKEIGASYANASTTYKEDGSMQHTEYAFAGGISAGSVNVSMHTGVQNTTVTDNGTNVYQKNSDVGLALGTGGTGVHYATEKTVVDEAGHQVTQGKNVDMAYSLADGKVDLGYGRHNKEVKDGVTQASETKLGLSVGHSQANMTAFTSHTTVDVNGNESSDKRGLMASINAREKKATYATYTSTGEKSYAAQLQTDGGMGLVAEKTVTRINEGGKKTTESQKTNVGLIHDEDGATHVAATSTNLSVDKDGNESSTIKGAAFDVNTNTVSMTRYKNNKATMHKASYNTEGGLSASASRTVTSHTAEGEEQTQATTLGGGFSQDENGNVGVTALKTKVSVNENGEEKVSKRGVEATLSSEEMTASAGFHSQHSSGVYGVNIKTEDGLGATATNTTTTHGENGSEQVTTTELRGSFNKDEYGNFEAAALKTTTNVDGNGEEKVRKYGVEADLSGENLTASAGRYGNRISNVYSAGVNTESSFNATAEGVSTKYGQDGSEQVATTKLRGGYSKDESGNLSAAALKTRITVDENGEEKVRKYGVEAMASSDDMTASVGRYGTKRAKSYTADLNTEGNLEATATSVNTTYSADGTGQTRTTELHGNIAKNGDNYTAVAERTTTSIDENGEEKVVHKGGQAGVDIAEKRATATWENSKVNDYTASVDGLDLSLSRTIGVDGSSKTGDKEVTTADANLKDLGLNVVQGVKDGKNVSTIISETKAAFKVETKLDRNIQQHAEAVGVDTKDVAEAQQKFEGAVDKKDEAKVQENSTQKNNDMAMVMATKSDNAYGA